MRGEVEANTSSLVEKGVAPQAHPDVEESSGAPKKEHPGKEDDEASERPYDFQEVTIYPGSVHAQTSKGIRAVSYVCSGVVNGNPVEMLLDSGCPASILDITQYYA